MKVDYWYTVIEMHEGDEMREVKTAVKERQAEWKDRGGNEAADEVSPSLWPRLPSRRQMGRNIPASSLIRWLDLTSWRAPLPLRPPQAERERCVYSTSSELAKMSQT